MLIQVAPKLAGDARTTPCDFSPLLAAGQSISSAVVTVSVYSGTDSAPPTFTAVASSPVVNVSEIGGVVGCIYLVKVKPNISISSITYLLAILPDQP